MTMNVTLNMALKDSWPETQACQHAQALVMHGGMSQCSPRTQQLLRR